MRFYAAIQKIVIVDSLDEANKYLSNGNILIDTLVTRDGDEVGFFDTVRFIIGLTDAR